MRLDHEKVRWHRDRLGWTLDTLAEKAEVAKGTVLRAEHEEDVRPSSGRRIARALGVEIRDLIPDKPRRVGELVGTGKAEAPREAGPSLLDKALDAARQDEKKDAGVMAREFASEGVAAEVASGYAEDKIRGELRRRGFPDEYFESFTWPLIVKAARADREDRLEQEQEHARLRREREQESAQQR